jgi:hypothetical protein
VVIGNEKHELAIVTKQMWLAILSSSLLSGICGAFIAGLYNLRAKRNDYVNDYYKTVIKRRIAAYEKLENLIVWLKAAVIDKDNRPYHVLFSRDNDWENAYKLLFDVMSQGLWLSDETFTKIRDLNYLLFSLKTEQGGMIEFGKDNYQVIAELRSELEKLLAVDMLSLHDVKRFLKCKKKKDHGFHYFSRSQT